VHAKVYEMAKSGEYKKEMKLDWGFVTHKWNH
jgi:hypothetical protein